MWRRRRSTLEARGARARASGRADIRAFLMTPREEFVTAENLDRAYEWHHLNVGFGVTITGPHTVARITNTIGGCGT